MKETWTARVRELTLQLARMPSVTNTPGEMEFALRLRDLLASFPYFQAHPNQLRVEQTIEDSFDRSNLYALVRGTGRRTVVLTGHYDVVGVENYGTLQPWAFDPPALLPRLIAVLEHEGSERDRLALADLKSGAFLVGRGALDMKSGLAAGIAVMERFSQGANRTGNLLLVATPDEEGASHGMRSAALRLPGLAREWNLELEAAINLDASDAAGDGSEGQAVYLGTVGKLLPSVLLVGRPTHAGSPFAGVHANLLAAEVTRRVECNVELLDIAEGEVAPPPVSLKQRDLKVGYDVTTPAAAWCYFNVLTHRRTPSEVLRQIVAISREALQGALSYLQEQHRRYLQLSGQPGTPEQWEPSVLTFAELRALVREQDAAAEQDLEELGRRLAADAGLDTPELCLRLTEAWWARSGLIGPAAVVGFAGPHYPRSQLLRSSVRHGRLRQAGEDQAAALAAELGLPIRLRPFFPGISDMSFVGGILNPADETAVVDNMPAWTSRIRFDYRTVRSLDLPVINVGPWGRDYHQRTERVYEPYAFAVVPELIWRIAGQVLRES